MAKTSRSGDRWYTDDLPGLPPIEVPSVTTILTALPKHALVKWAAKEVADVAWARRQQLAAADDDDREAWVSSLKGAPWETRDNAADRGTAVHTVMEHLLLGQEPPAFGRFLEPWIESGRRFVEERKPEAIWTETTVFSRTHGYAGSFDLLCHLPGYGLCLVDFKTGKDVYGDYALQLSAYRFADYAVVGRQGGKRVKLPRIDNCVIVLVNERGYRVVPVTAGQSQLLKFLAVRQVWEFQRESRSLLGRDWYGEGVDDQSDPSPYLVQLREYLRGRILTYSPEMATELAAVWPPVPTFKWARENSYLHPHHELVAVEAEMVKLEARHGHQFSLSDRPAWWLPCRVCGEPSSTPDIQNSTLRVHPACEADPLGSLKRQADQKTAKTRSASAAKTQNNSGLKTRKTSTKASQPE